MDMIALVRAEWLFELPAVSGSRDLGVIADW